MVNTRVKYDVENSEWNSSLRSSTQDCDEYLYMNCLKVIYSKNDFKRSSVFCPSYYLKISRKKVYEFLKIRVIKKKFDEKNVCCKTNS